MKVTYIGHSGYLVETQEAYLLFDCMATDKVEENEIPGVVAGVLPPMDVEKELFVFASHAHIDHYCHKIWQLKQRFHNIHYILSKDIVLSNEDYQKHNISVEDRKNILFMDGDESFEYALAEGGQLKIETLCSTDVGVAFYLTINGRTIYHAGDLNLWVWRGLSDEENADMTQRFNKELDKLKGRKTDIAFLLIDSRQGKEKFSGIDAYLQAMDVKYAFPMHFWKRYKLIPQYIEERKEMQYASCVQVVERTGQTFECE